MVQAQSQSDTIYTGNITVEAQVNALNTTLAGKTSIDGSVTIRGSDITDLTPLSSIVRITRNFEVRFNDSLTPSKKAIDVSDLPSGMYFVILQGEEQTWTEVLIIVN